MLAYVIDDNRSCRELVKALIQKIKGTEVETFSNPFAMYMALQEKTPDMIVIDYDFGGYRFPKGAMDCLKKLGSKTILLSSHDWEYINKDFKRRKMKMPSNMEYLRKGELEGMRRIEQMAAL